MHPLARTRSLCAPWRRCNHSHALVPSISLYERAIVYIIRTVELHLSIVGAIFSMELKRQRENNKRLNGGSVVEPTALQALGRGDWRDSLAWEQATGDGAHGRAVAAIVAATCNCTGGAGRGLAGLAGALRWRRFAQ
jgi:hypothetical protein